MLTILIVEDDKNTRKLLVAILASNNYNAITAQDGMQALDILDHNHVDLIIVDAMMPRLDGFQLTECLRSCNNQTPMLMLTAKQGVDDVKQGFIVGIDDYMTKPFNQDELTLRIKALLRRSRIVAEKRLQLGTTTLIYDNLTVSTGEHTEELPQKEFLLLYKLLSYPNKIFTRLALMDEIWGMDSMTDEHTVNVHINRLRTRFADNPDFDIVTVRGLGYKGVRKDVK
ncbi:MAG: response regulator transcription factor [Clostridia bacterium]|nr:response regulator transcription factor [Clostridia bacterium]MDD3832100.1 response regulator transcription factor [Clostridia bacterium]